MRLPKRNRINRDHPLVLILKAHLAIFILLFAAPLSKLWRR